eukprot:g46005.t1
MNTDDDGEPDNPSYLPRVHTIFDSGSNRMLIHVSAECSDLTTKKTVVGGVQNQQISFDITATGYLPVTGKGKQHWLELPKPLVSDSPFNLVSPGVLDHDRGYSFLFQNEQIVMMDKPITFLEE